MKKLVSVLSIVGVIAAAAVMSGCGGGDDNKSSNNNNGGTSFAPATLANQSVTLTENGASRDIQFAASGNTFTQFQSGTTNAVGTGTYQYTQQGPNNGQVIVTTTDQNGATQQVTYNLAFTSATAGTYTFTGTGGLSGSGTFSNLQTTTNNGGNNGGGNNGGGNNNGGGSTNAPTALAGKAIDFTATGQGNERLTFAATGNQVTSDAVNPPNNVGTYTYTAGANGAPSTLVVNFPNGDNYNLTMTFTDATHGTWAGTQHFDNADHPVPANSSFTIQP